MTRIICIGHALLACDNAGPQLFKKLQNIPLGPQVELIDGGLQGLNLLRFFENCRRVILIDSVCGYLPQPGVIHLPYHKIDATLSPHHDHAAGLTYLLQMLPNLIEPLPKIELLGIEGELTETITNEVLEKLWQCLKIGKAA